jgi:protein subunit release factor A
MKQLLFSVTAKDCDWDTMTAGGKGGQHQNRKRTAVRCTHRASGAVGEARDSRSQDDNKRAAFVRMSQTKKFQNWLRVEAALQMGQRPPEKVVDDLMHPKNLKIECRTAKGWEQCQS